MVVGDILDRIDEVRDAAENDELLDRITGGISDGLESGISSLGAGLLNAFLDVIRYIGPAIIEGIVRTYRAVRSVLEGQEVNAITAGTTVFLGLFAGIYLFNFARTAGAHVIPNTLPNVNR